MKQLTKSLLFLFLLSATIVSGQCPDSLFVTQTGCGTVQAHINHYGDTGNIIWSWGDGNSSIGMNPAVHEYEFPGTYNICAEAWSGDCPEGVEICTSFFVEQCSQDCGLQIQTVIQEDDLLQLVALGYPEGAFIHWEQDGELVNIGSETTFNLEFGDNEICVYYETPECPDSVFWCETYYFQNPDCPSEIIVSEEECGVYTASIQGGNSGGTVLWSYADTSFIGAETGQTIHLNHGNQIVTGSFSHPDYPLCDNTLLTNEVFVPLCDSICDLSVLHGSLASNPIDFHASIYDPNGQIQWTVNGVEVSSENNYNLHMTEPGQTYNVCATYTSAYCDEEVSWCETVLFPDCPIALDLQELECGLYQVSMVGGHDGAVVEWDFQGNIYTSDASPQVVELEPWVNVISAAYSHEDYPECDGTVLSTFVWVTTCDSICGLDVQFTPGSAGNYLVANTYLSNGNVEWTVDGSFAGTGDSLALSSLNPGEYLICAGYETSSCPQGVSWCDSISIGDPNACPFELIVEETNDCGCYDFAISEAGAGSQYMWNMGDTTYLTFSHTTTYCFEPGFQTMYVQIMNSNYPDCENAPLVHQWEVPECEESDCTLNIEVVQDGDILYFTPYNYPDNATIFWSVNGEGNEPGEVFNFDLSEPGTYQICAAYETPECPQGVFWCETWTVEDDECPFELSVDEVEGCGCYELSLNEQWGQDYIWNLGDTSFTSSSNSVVHCYDPGNFTGYVQILGSNYPECEQQPVVFSIEVPECEENPCELNIEVVQDGDILYFTPYNYPDNATIFWSVNGEGNEPGEVFNFDLSEPGTYQICAAYETPECPEGVFWCETFFGESLECPAELYVLEEEECGCYMFSINPPNIGDSYIWNLGDSVFTSSTPSVSHCFEPGFQTVYVQIMNSNYPDCENAPLVHQWEVPECEDPECYWFAFELATNLPGVSFDLAWSVNELGGDQAGTGTIEVEGDTAIYNGEVCVGVGCYVFEFTAPFPIGLDELDIDFVSVIDPLVPVTIEWIQDDNPYTVTAQIGIGETCDWSVSIDENALDMTRIFPVPANNILNIQLGQQAQTDLRMYNASGQLLLEQSIQQSGPIDVSGLPAGLYLLQLQQGSDFKTFSIPLLN